MPFHPTAFTPLDLLTPAETAAADRAAVALGRPVAWLMENAGRAVARAVRARLRPCRTLVLCGPGNNGGDGYVAARYLAAAGWPVGVAALAPAKGEAAAAAARWRGPVTAFTAAEAARAELVIDAVFGAGLARPLDPAVAEVLRAARRLVAVDVPSGLDGATGTVRGFAPQAVLTVTFFRLKPGHLLLPGRALCGETVLADIGLPAAALAAAPPRAFRNAPGLWTVPSSGAEDHKYSRGHVTVLGGAVMTGAARLAAAAARRAGAGMVTIAATGSAAVYRAGEPGLIVDERPLATLLQDSRRTAWVCGPGLGAETARSLLPALLPTGRQVVVDADALTICAGQPEHLRGASVLTPHAGEFARVFGPPGEDRPAAVRAAAARTGAVVLLKGADTLVAAPDGRVAINDNAPPWLATAGAGDVLAGIIAALLAQGMPAWEATCAAAWAHGRAAALAGPGLIAEDLAPLLPRALAEARGGG
ncbi:NAD(P)H-hydrate dehydratase [Rhodovastum atsumiense]|uniref:Bifunctional NAD(P)H-hydrate repair enzyme n=1 Tax=Rhodovastum atsumiense TaxID=504468 RepID=A0A5M6J495_9PROT|nr:NAD(P)H-hydrate dehydratase [Rhodovastum atsumiense]KAA5614388.1 NAD(P)H-hydrate dehydratase [Rhodovastum atsumiense]